MRVLLDTHALLWWLLSDARLSRRAQAAIAGGENTIHVSAVTGLEVATKHRLGKLEMGSLSPRDLASVLSAQRLEPLPITLEHAIEAGGLRGPHRDPFDRLLIAQSRLESIPIVTRDPVFQAYGVDVIW